MAVAVGCGMGAGAALPASAAADTEPPVITFRPNPRTPPPSATGWYRDLSPFGTLPFVVDFFDASGLTAVGCTGLLDFAYGPPTLLSTSFGFSAGVAADGVYTLDCDATDQLGNRGVGAGSSGMPIVIRIDTTPPVVTCRQTPLRVVRFQHARLRARVSDATSGPVQSRVRVPVDTRIVGSFAVSVTGTDVAGNSATVDCNYIVCGRHAGPLHGVRRCLRD